MQHAGDISWPVLRRIVQDWAGTSAELSEVSHLDGGSISTTLLLTTTGDAKAVLKISPYRVDRSYESEAHDLDLLRPLGIPTPRVYQCVTGTLDDPNSFSKVSAVSGKHDLFWNDAVWRPIKNNPMEHAAPMTAT